MADEHCQGKCKEEEEAATVFEQHVGEKINVIWKEQVRNDHVGCAAAQMEQGDESKECWRGGGLRADGYLRW